MKGFVWSQFRFRRNRVLVLGLAILVAAVSFVLLTSTAKTSSLQIQGTVKSNFRPAYDILVRPRRSKTVIERTQGLVPPNYSSGIFGGISLREWRQVLNMRGVEVAAPVANIGYVFAFRRSTSSARPLPNSIAASDLSRCVLARVQRPLVVSRSPNGLRLRHQESRRLRPLSRPHRVCRAWQDAVSLRRLLCLCGKSPRGADVAVLSEFEPHLLLHTFARRGRPRLPEHLARGRDGGRGRGLVLPSVAVRHRSDARSASCPPSANCRLRTLLARKR